MFKEYEIDRQKEKSEVFKSTLAEARFKTDKSNIENIISESIRLENVLLKNFSKVSIFEKMNNGGLNRLSLVSSAYVDSLKYLNEYEARKATEYDENILCEEENINKITKRIERKLSLLLGKKGEYSNILEETFTGYSNLKKQATSLNIDTEEGLATLPIAQSKEVECRKIIIGEKSKGVIGKESGGNNLITDILTDSKESFSFHNRDKCILELNFEFKESLINFISLEKDSLSKAGTFFIKNIVINTNDNRVVKIEINEKVKNRKNIYFLPRIVNKISIVVEQEESYIKDDIRYYEIDIKRIKFKENKYGNSGIVKSKVFKVKESFRAFNEVQGSDLNFCNITTKINNQESKNNEFVFKDRFTELFYETIVSKNLEANRSLIDSLSLKESSKFYSQSRIVKCSNGEVEKRYIYQELEGEISCNGSVCVIPNLKSLGANLEDFEIRYLNNNIAKENLDEGTNQSIDSSSASKAILQSKEKPLCLEERKNEYLFEVDSNKEIFGKEYFKILDKDNRESEINFECKVIGNKEWLSFSKDDLEFVFENIRGASIPTKLGVVVSSIKMDGVALVEYVDGNKEFKEVFEKEEVIPSNEIDESGVIFFELSERPSNSNSIVIKKENSIITSNLETISGEELLTVERAEKDQFFYLAVENQIGVVASLTSTLLEGYKVGYETGSLEKDSLMSYNKATGEFFFSENIQSSLETRNLSFKRCELKVRSTAGKLLKNVVIEDGYADVSQSYNRLVLNSTLRKSEIVCIEYESENEDFSDKIEFCTPIINLIRINVI